MKESAKPSQSSSLPGSRPASPKPAAQTGPQYVSVPVYYSQQPQVNFMYPQTVPSVSTVSGLPQGAVPVYVQPQYYYQVPHAQPQAQAQTQATAPTSAPPQQAQQLPRKQANVKLDDSKIKHVVVLMLENRSFDHMLGWMKKENADVDGLNGNESNPFNPSDPSSLSATVNLQAPYITVPDPDHGFNSINEQLWGTTTPSTPLVDPAPMNGFVQNYRKDGSTQDEGASVMDCFSSDRLPVMATLAREFAVCDRWFASVPSSTQPNRMYAHSCTSHGMAHNITDDLILGLPQKTVYDELYENGISWKVYFNDFPGVLFCRKLRRKKYIDNFKLFKEFKEDCKNGTLPAYSWIEPRWYQFLFWKPSDQHPPHDARFGEYLIADVYEALRNSPSWENTVLLITYDEHGGYYDHVPPPLKNIPNPDGITSLDPPFNFDRLGVRIPSILISPWIQKGTVVHRPPSNNLPTKDSELEHSSIMATLRKMFNIPGDPLTKREAFAATFDFVWQQIDTARTDCPTTLKRPSHTSLYPLWKLSEEKEETPENIREGTQKKMMSTQPITELQREFLQIANGLVNEKYNLELIKTEHQGAVFVRKVVKEFFKNLAESNDD